MAQRSVAAKELLFREDEPGDYAYVLQSGRVEILKHAAHGEVQLAVLEPGAVFGEMALFDATETRSATARALEDCTLDALSADEFQLLLAKCPGEVLPFLETLISRVKTLNQRVADLERADVVLGAEFDQMTIAPGSEALQGVFAPVTVKVANLPFTIGGYAKDGDPSGVNDLELSSDGPPLVISQKHVKIERQTGGVYVVDVGSRFTSALNGQEFGRAKVSFKAPLTPGENHLRLGAYDSPYTLKILCE